MFTMHGFFHSISRDLSGYAGHPSVSPTAESGIRKGGLKSSSQVLCPTLYTRRLRLCLPLMLRTSLT
jgi:hypothetical protein